MIWPVIRLLLLMACVIAAGVGSALFAYLTVYGPDHGLSFSKALPVGIVGLGFAAAAVWLWVRPKTRTWRRIALATLCGVVALPFVGLAWFDATYFKPQLDTARAKTAYRAERAAYADPRVARLIDAAAGDALEGLVIRHVLLHAPDPANGTRRYGGLAWIPAQVAAGLLVRVHSNRDEMRRLYAAWVYEGRHGRGIRAGALGMYGKEPAALTTPELARVVAYSWGPAYLDKRPELLARRASELEAKLAASP